MRFSLFGIPVHVQPGFWLMAALLGFPWITGEQPDVGAFGLWVVVVFFSIMVHEFGHALAIMRHGIQPAISLHMLGGLTSWRDGHKLSRPNRIFISFAGPLAGFVLGGTVFVLRMAAPEAFAGLPRYGYLVVNLIEYVNIFWGLINLIPVLPLDGGHILEDTLGPTRKRTTAIISLVTGGLVVLVCVAQNQWWIAFLFGMLSFQSFQRLQEGAPARAHAEEPLAAEPPAEPYAPEPIEPQIMARLHDAGRALEEGRYNDAGSAAEALLDDEPPAPVRLDALHIVAWAYLLGDEPKQAARVIDAIGRLGMVDPALAGAVLLAEERFDEAREVLEGARALGDDRKEIVGPLIQILIRQEEIARAAALALDITESLSDNDIRQMADIASKHSAFAWASRLFEVLFERDGSPENGYDAARLRALEGDDDGAIALLRRAVAAGFSDAARAWSDAALEKMRTGEVAQQLADLLPQPASLSRSDNGDPAPSEL
jgi:Zn-dependent protease